MGVKATYFQTNFNSGEISPRALGRFDLAKYANAVKKLLNFLVYQLGGAMYRPGTRYVSEVKDSDLAVRLIEFQFSTSQSYVIEVGDLYMRFYTDGAQVQSGGLPIELDTPYLEADLFNLQFTQDADTMYIVHNNYAPRKMQRTDPITFTLREVPFVRPPFLDSNINKQRVNNTSATNNTNLTASNVAWATSTTYIVDDSINTGGLDYRCIIPHISGVFATDFANGFWIQETFAPFQVGHIGSFWRVRLGVIKITAFTSGTSVSGEVQAEPDGTDGNIGGTGNTTDYSEGAFSAVRGYPSVVAFHEQRLFYASTLNNPQTLWGSFIAAYDNFFKDDTNDDASVTFEIVSEQVNAIRFLSSGPKGLAVGTAGGTFTASSGTLGTPITPTNINVTKDTNYGVANIRPKRISSYVYYLQRNLNQVRELYYDFGRDSQIAGDMTLLADHILEDGQGAKDMAHQQTPNDRLWIVRNDGQMAVLTRNPEQDVVGWSRLSAGRSAIGDGLFESVAIIPQEGDNDQIWTLVRRNISGSFQRYIEYFTSENFVNYWDPVRLDSSLTYDVPIDIVNITQTNPVVVTAPAHGIVNGDKVKIDSVIGVNESLTSTVSAVNKNLYFAANVTADTLELVDEDSNPIDGTGFSDYISGGQIRDMVTLISNLDHLEGETVSVFVDGGVPAAQQTYVVSGGAITLAHKAAVVHVGLPYNGDLQFLKLSDGSRETGQGKMRRIYLSTMRVFKSLRVLIGQTESSLSPIYFGVPNDPLGRPPEFFTGDVEKVFDAFWSKDAEVFIRQDQPLPLFILLLLFRSEVEEK